MSLTVETAPGRTSTVQGVVCVAFWKGMSRKRLVLGSRRAGLGIDRLCRSNTNSINFKLKVSPRRVASLV